ncbi:sugar ABC transporter permease [Streptomyces sp. DSM 41524]|uniref:ABC transporter permease n=3 Tax=Streptomyces violaceusniger group TaxID=2839105 RepID=A0A0A0NDZ0_STRRN|nr:MULTISPECIES: sugar ABC transporter permease [Streptomyces]MEE4597743.1 sugar ABC transporter permease [Streptomyces sp. DSM 41524]AGP57697.1 ABC transporter permease [Streptomyces rapamycinicus NRRL 5491]MBB4785363.1 multiple sugar transport system permease protein [Streptomyces rapamycinicus]RLV79168.1 ABC transporter permease [Streptomyces rapamycinicus NRRL 5491]TMU94534.1 sugar ABC transporter permease [Streptomyces sp. DASNCL29]
MTATATRPPDAAPPATGGKRAPKRERQGAAWVFLSPWVLGAAVLTLLPMAVSLYLSFTDYDMFDAPRWIGFRNYTQMFTEDPRYWRSVITTLTYVVIAVPLQLLLALAVAIALKSVKRGKGFYRSAFYAPSLLGASMSIALVWRAIFNDGGSVDNLLSGMGIDIGGWINKPGWAILSVALLTIWQFGAPMVIFLAGLQQIPAELYEAAAVDGASWWRQFRSITIPMLSPVLFFNLVLQMIQAFQVFTPAFAVSAGKGGPADSTLVYTLYLYDRGFTASHMGYASAMAWALLLAIGVVTAVLFRTSRAWVFYANDNNEGAR